MKFIKGFLNFFTVITSCILLMVALSHTLGDCTGISENILWDIILSGAVTALVTAAIYSIDFKSQKQFVIMTLVHYLLLCIVMVFLGTNFGWITFDFRGILMMAVDVALVYIMVFVITYLVYKKEADQLNEALEKKYRNK